MQGNNFTHCLLTISGHKFTFCPFTSCWPFFFLFFQNCYFKLFLILGGTGFKTLLTWSLYVLFYLRYWYFKILVTGYWPLRIVNKSSYVSIPLPAQRFYAYHGAGPVRGRGEFQRSPEGSFEAKCYLL